LTSHLSKSPEEVYLNPSISQYLEDLQQQGLRDSSGQFTLDPRRAKEFLRDCQLREKHHYVLCLVSFLIGQGARSISLDSYPDRIEIKGQGITLDREILANPFEGLFASQGRPALRELAIGINSALIYPQSRMLLRSSDGIQGHYQGDQFKCEAWEGLDLQEVHCTLWRKGEARLEPEATAQHFACSPVPLTVQGNPLPSSIPNPDNCLVLEILPGRPQVQLLRHSNPTVHHQLTRPGPFHALFWVGEGEPVCRWIHLGRCYEKPLPWRFRQVPLQMWVACDLLDKDLSLSQLVENERYQRASALLHEYFVQGLDQVLERVLQPGGFLSDQMRAIRPLIDQALEVSAQQGQRQLALELQKSLISTPASPEAHRLDQFRMSLLTQAENPTVPEPEFLDELWSMARASLAILGPRQRLTQQLLFRSAEAAFHAQRHDLVVAALGPYLQALPSSTKTAQVQAQYGHSLLQRGRIHEAYRQLNQSATLNAQLKEPPEWSLQAMEDLATCQAQLGDHREAAKMLADVLRQRQAQWGSRSTRLGLLLRRLAEICRKLNETQTADHYEKWANQLDE